MDKINKKLNIPNKLTIFRFIIAFLIMIFFILELDSKFLIILSLFSTGVITDALDGYLARNYFEITIFGKLMDPLADKVLLAVVLIGLVEFEMLKGWMVACIFAREFMVTGLRLLLVSNNQIISADIWGKLKTIIQMIFVLLLLCGLAFPNISFFPTVNSVYAFYLGVIMVFVTLFSGFKYFYSYREFIKDS